MKENKVLIDEQNKKKINAEIKEILPLIKNSVNFLEGDECVISKAFLLLLLSLTIDTCSKKIRYILKEGENK